MQNIYDITKGQLITIWVFGVVCWLSSAVAMLESDNPIFFWLLLLIPFIEVFYTIGWRNAKKTNS